MGGSKSKTVIMFVMLLIIFEGGWSEGCLDHERFALLRLKHFFNDTGSYLYYWGDGEGATDCCQWEMVECSNTTGRVIALDLSGTYSGEYSWYLNASLFTPFQQLESLALRGNNITGFVENEGLERLSNLKRLDLSDNLFNNSILSSVAHLSSLTSLDLSYNGLEGSINIKEFDSLSNLEELHMSYNEIDNFEVPQALETLSRLSNLTILDLSHNLFNNSILSFVARLSSLTSLDLSYNGWEGSINIKGEIPEWTAQFATFNESSYEGNTFLCGLPLPICRSPATMSEASIGNERDDNLIDMDSFFITFTTSYVIVIFAIVIILYVNSYWRRRWFYFVEMWITSSYYFVVDNLIPTRFCH